ncbi:LPS export ABC transporter periplasmic protein LptC [Candidatus Halobeggiatoa sp. HSG11]|nr:LPS export ABC transporter periplasmic protein LptC [Candidatus Halobeggiatoa sp. HSG11]
MLKYWIVLVSLVFITTWLLRSVDDDAILPPEDELKIPDYTLINFNSTRMDESGQLKSKLTAVDMIHYPNVNTSITEPNMIFYRDKQPLWTVQAENGELSPKADQVWLLGDTVLQQYTKKPIKIISQDLWVKIDTEYAQTDAPTTIISHFGETKSTGMRIFMPIEQIELFSKVRGRYVLQ